MFLDCQRFQCSITPVSKCVPPHIYNNPCQPVAVCISLVKVCCLPPPVTGNHSLYYLLYDGFEHAKADSTPFAFMYPFYRLFERNFVFAFGNGSGHLTLSPQASISSCPSSFKRFIRSEASWVSATTKVFLISW